MSERTVVVTGASRRLGLFLCEKFLAESWRVIALSRKASPELENLHRESNGMLHTIEMGPISAESIEASVGDIRNLTQSIDVLIHNASIYEADDSHCDNLDVFYQDLFQVHMSLPAQLNYSLEGALSSGDNPGNIIHITRIFSKKPSAKHILYSSTKAGLENLMKGFAKKLSPNIRVNSIQPGPIKFLDSHSEIQKEEVISETLLAYEAGFLPIFQTVRYIIDNEYLTGSSIKVDGGRSLGRR